MRGKPVGDNFDCRRIRQHPGLHSANVVDAKNRVKLRGDEVDGNGVDCRNTMRILRRERGEHSATVKPVGVERAKIGLYAGIAAGVASGDSETARR